MNTLQALFDFYNRRYKGKEMEDKFNAAAVDLVEADDIRRPDYIKFCIANDIESIIDDVEPKQRIRRFNDNPVRTSDPADGCSSGGRSNYRSRSSC